MLNKLEPNKGNIKINHLKQIPEWQNCLTKDRVAKKGYDLYIWDESLNYIDMQTRKIIERGYIKI
ncbi:hypothetical protein [Geotoga petraea]|uniref:hypothetical protein n=1 Tax=Geotoga petraea TaxID=28234 RepID=UPI000B848ED9|nr:hypothetical protein [Geotoga petraea]